MIIVWCSKCRLSCPLCSPEGSPVCVVPLLWIGHFRDSERSLLLHSPIFLPMGCFCICFLVLMASTSQDVRIRAAASVHVVQSVGFRTLSQVPKWSLFVLLSQPGSSLFAIQKMCLFCIHYSSSFAFLLLLFSCFHASAAEDVRIRAAAT